MSSQIEYKHFRKGEQCTYEGCRERRYYIADGKAICRRGHEQEGFRQVQTDEDDFNTQGRVSRRKREKKERVTRVFSGREAAECYLQAWQLVLWKQVSWLIKVKDLPEELETVIRDLWAVRLRGVKVLGEELLEDGDGDGGLGGYSSQSGLEQTITETEMAEGSEIARRKKKAARDQGMPKLIDTLGLCYLGMLLMRIPVSLGELHRWAEQEDIIYFRAIKEVPKEMRRRLPAQYHAALESRSVLRRGELQKVVLELVISFKQKFDLVFPPLNTPLVMFKHVRDLCLPLDIYAAARRLAKLLKFDFTFPDDMSRHSHLPAAYPETQIICLIIVATKLCQPFDDITRVPESITDPTVLKIDWEVWQKIMKDEPQEGFKKGEQIGMTDSDALQWGEQKLDEYLDWYQRTWIDDRDPKRAQSHVPQQLLDLFPLEDLPFEIPTSKPEIISTEDRLKRMTSCLVWQKPILIKDEDEGRDINRPGSFYRRYQKVDDLPASVKAFYTKAAENVGLSVETIVRAVYLIEGKLFSWMTEDKRSKLAAEPATSADEMDSEDE